jgi:hypothetical protein
VIRSKLSTLLALALLSTAALACSGKQAFVGDCAADSDCGVGARCKITGADDRGLCVCRSDEACQDGEVCNSQGVCQARSGCRSNAECDATRFCDLGTGDCLERTRCGSDVHCPPGTICDPSRGACVDGCRENGDCTLGAVCEGGRCLKGRCADKSFCEYGDICVGGACQPHPNGAFCQDCGQGRPCPSPTDYCLLNSGYDPARPDTGSASFCGVSCSSEDQCPNGYQCGGVVLLTSDQCTQDAQCGAGRVCVLGEGDLRGFCTCVSDQDCAFEEFPALCAGSCGGLGLQACLSDADCARLPCDLTRRTCLNPSGRACTSDAQCQATPLCGPLTGFPGNVCANTGSPCASGADCLCQAGTCINSGRPCARGQECNPPCQGGGCVLGAACAPLQGLLCPDVR